ncbi:hypothetical protein SFBM_0337 [Candidatus Arthromitus sp. SFB-mouse-Japan]|uniref:SdpI family protein n=1 Tax=Candidatus Arthromitus sp. SFB-mouse TaxID=49118 RepID=UPI00021B7DC1|nr:SdpI family protein [Candidatus Arthromitus sp. SFB-mouse]BAK56116.1 hypothetical protein SFBM_0337 [Candidatus Arthromitus sp. SFB-mouse-Japan]
MNKKIINNPLILSLALCLLPTILCSFIYNKLPDKIPTHFDINGNIDSYGSKLFICIILPLILCIFNIITHLIINNDPNKKNHNKSLKILIYFLAPLMSVIFIPTTILISLGININMSVIAPVFMSIIFIFIGNYLPKCRQNYTIGIRLPWTLNNKENWKKTHRLAGLLFVISGILNILITIIFPNLSFYTLTISLIVSAIIPAIYSFLMYKKYKNT